MMKGEHTVRRNGFEIVYWDDNVACGHLDDWSSATIIARNGEYKTLFAVDNTYDLEKLCIILDRVYAAGMKRRSKEIMELLQC